MDIAGGAAALVGIMICAALAGWTLGRWQGGTITADADRAAAPVLAAGIAPVRRARTVDQALPWTEVAGTDNRSAELATAGSLAQMHEEIIAYRRTQQILANLSSDALHLIANHARARGECAGQDASGAGPHAVFEVFAAGSCGCTPGCRNTAQEAATGTAGQAPAFVPSGLTRV